MQPVRVQYQKNKFNLVPMNQHTQKKSSSKLSLDTGKQVEWPKHLRTPAELVQALGNKTKLNIIRSPLYSKLVLQFIGSLAYILVHVLNKSRVYNIEVFNEELRRLEKRNQAQSCSRSVDDDDEETGQLCQNTNAGDSNQLIKGPQAHKLAPLITLSNHISCIDDPVLWGNLLPFNYYFTQTEDVRWVGAAVDICFSRPWHSTFFSLGKTFPIVRGAGLNQPAMQYAWALLKHNQWLHLFPEGRVMRDDNQQVISNKDRGYNFKWGISKLILDYFKSSQIAGAACDEHSGVIRILPLYHLGMDKVLPIGRPYIPRFNKNILIYIRPSVIEMNSRLLASILKDQTLSVKAQKSRTDDEISRIKLTNYLEQEMEKLIEPATRLHQETNN